MLYTSSADQFVVSPGVRERTLVQQHLSASRLGRAFMHFKMWPLAAMHKMVVRNYVESLSTKDKVVGYMAMVGMGALAGYLRMTAKDVIVNGEEPQIPATVGGAIRIALAPLAQSGGRGIFGDMVFGELNRFDASKAGSVISTMRAASSGG
jgi:hypothetical protein